MRDTVKCHDNCHYRNRYAPFCSFCMMKVLGKLKEEKKGGENNGQETEYEGHYEDAGSRL